MELLERETQLALLSTALAEARAGSGRLALVSGEAGIGKTSLVEAFTRVLKVCPDDRRTCKACCGQVHYLVLDPVPVEWQAAGRHYSSLESLREVTHPEVLLEDIEPLRLAPIHQKRNPHTARCGGSSSAHRHH